MISLSSIVRIEQRLAEPNHEANIETFRHRRYDLWLYIINRTNTVRHNKNVIEITPQLLYIQFFIKKKFIHRILLISQWGLSGINNNDISATTGTIVLKSTIFLQCKKFPNTNCDIDPSMTVVDDRAESTPRI